jgi:hypothetical protein
MAGDRCCPRKYQQQANNRFETPRQQFTELFGQLTNFGRPILKEQSAYKRTYRAPHTGTKCIKSPAFGGKGQMAADQVTLKFQTPVLLHETLGRAHVVNRQGLRDKTNPGSATCNPKPKVGVLGYVQTGLKHSRFLQDFFLYQHGPRPATSMGQGGPEKIIKIFLVSQHLLPQFGVNINSATILIAQTVVEIGGSPYKVLISHEQLCLTAESFGEPFIIGVKKCDPFAGSGFDTSVSRNTWAGVFLINIANIRAELLDPLGGLVSRAVINDDYLIRPAALSQNAFDGARNGFLGIVSRDYNTDTYASVIVF